jgi:hypothetical protein
MEQKAQLQYANICIFAVRKATHDKVSTNYKVSR